MQKRQRVGYPTYCLKPMHGIHNPLCPPTAISKGNNCLPGPSKTWLPPPIGRMDLVVTDSDFSTLLADFTITHPNPSANQAVTPAMMRRGHFAEHRENTKNNKYSDTANAIGAKSAPLVLETYGSLGKSFQSLLKSLASELFRRSINSDI